MLETGMQKNMKSVPKWSQNGNQNQEKAGQKRGPKNDAKKSTHARRVGAFLRLIISSRLVFRLVLTSFHVSERLVTPREVVFPVR